MRKFSLKSNKQAIIKVALIVVAFLIIQLAGKQGNSIETFLNSEIIALSEEQKKHNEQPLSAGESCRGKKECAAVVARVVDGDTVVLASGERVRYIGIDTPETVHPNKQVECFGKEASAKNKELVEGREARLVRDISDADKYGRLLRYVYVGDILINDYLIRNGFANASSFPPDIAFQALFEDAERAARENRSGLWAEGACGSP